MTRAEVLRQEDKKGHKGRKSPRPEQGEGVEPCPPFLSVPPFKSPISRPSDSEGEGEGGVSPGGHGGNGKRRKGRTLLSLPLIFNKTKRARPEAGARLQQDRAEGRANAIKERKKKMLKKKKKYQRPKCARIAHGFIFRMIISHTVKKYKNKLPF